MTAQRVPNGPVGDWLGKRVLNGPADNQTAALPIPAPVYTVTCLDCPRSEQVTWLPMQWSAGPCHECAQSSVTKHLEIHPGHRCGVTPTQRNEAS